MVVEAYQGLGEFLSDDPAELRSARGLGLPLAELADALGCRFTVLVWDAWRKIEVPAAVTRPVISPLAPPLLVVQQPDLGPAVSYRPVPAREPERRFLAQNDPLVFLSRCLEEELARLFREEPFAAVVVPLWGGLGHLAQMARATGTAGFDAPFAVVVTDPSVLRQRANEEGVWTRPAQVRRQAEDMSLALADLTLTFGPRGDALARAGRPPGSPPPIRAPRRVDPELLARLVAASEHPASPGPLRPFLDEPQDAASGVLAALDAVRLLSERWIAFGAPVACAGPDMIFAPLRPQSFERYWSSRAWVRELRASGFWDWTRGRPGGGGLPLRLWPSRFEFLPDVWSELARSSAVLLSPAAAEGLAPGEDLPLEVLLGGEPTPERLADRLSDLLLQGPERIDNARRELCRKAAAGHQGKASRRLLRDTAEALDGLLRAPSAPNLGAASRLLLDRTRTLRQIGIYPMSGPVSGPREERVGKTTLSVVFTCHDPGPSLREAVEQVWASDLLPDEVLLVDDGSRTEATRASLADLERTATARGLPWSVLQQGHRGLAAARNAGLAAAGGDVVTFLDGSDLVEPSFFRLAVDLITRHPDLGGVASWSIGPVPHPELPLLFVESCLFSPFLIRTELLRGLGGYDARQRYYGAEDWELSLRLLAAGWPLVTIPAFLVRPRPRPELPSTVYRQTLRERLLEAHRETAARFGLEIALQEEHRQAALEAASAAAGPKPLWKRTARRVLSLAGRRRR